MARLDQTVVRSGGLSIEMNKVLKNTYFLLAATLLFSAAVAGVSMAMNVPYFGIIPTLIGYFGLLFLTQKFRNSAFGIVIAESSAVTIRLDRKPM